MILYFGFLISLTILIAASFASVPEVEKKNLVILLGITLSSDFTAVILTSVANA
jgi:hypothetical protein